MKILSGNPYLKVDKGELVIDSIKMSDILMNHDPPIMIFLENRIRYNVNTFISVFSSVFGKKFEGFYSFKANFLPEICKIIGSEGFGAEVIGNLELNLALKVGFPANQIIAGGPYLSEEFIENCIKNHVKEIVVYNLSDLNRINSISRKYNMIQDICIRVNSLKFNSRLGIRLNEKNLALLKKNHVSYKNIKLKSILSHYASQMNNINQFKSNINSILESLINLKKIGMRIENVNLGGGFPEATIMPKKQLLKTALEIKSLIKEGGIDYDNIYIEPGRYIVGDTGLFLAKVIKTYDDRWIYLNIGNHICPKFARCSLRFYNASRLSEPHKYKTSIAGIVPTDQDVLAKNYFFTEKLMEGDVVIITNVGAYALTFSNRFPYILPKIFLVKESNFSLIFDPEKNHDFSLH